MADALPLVIFLFRSWGTNQRRDRSDNLSIALMRRRLKFIFRTADER
jgi:hypothetical protein